MTPAAVCRALRLSALLCAAAPYASAHDAEVSAAAEALLYELPAAGSYALPPIDRVSDHQLLDADGERGPLLALAPGEYAVVAFVYLSCSDASGCPLSLASLYRFDRALAQRPDLRDRVHLVTVSFDPDRDHPAEMAKLRERLAPKSDWRFFTAADRAVLAPVLADFGQDAVPLTDASGAPLGRLRHVTKVFLVDDENRVRNIYSSGFLDHRIVLRDLETLVVARDRAQP